MSQEEAAECLEGEPPGTFMIRFSPDGQYCASFVSRSAPMIRHFKIVREGQKYRINDPWLEKGNWSETQFSSIEHLANYFIAAALFTQPAPATSIFTKNRISQDKKK